ncbi:FAS1 domain-containing protein [Lasiosphaeria miniovina]|uniref:FAS1 domain-containing protein n=1 Tax=Lasiosphaeria miniovina TaxID=1954250 RepID=A0AA40BG93_9PEZI|nr:FAS1 domain-containing protein [Lasiosphaeria miniovina]KAK0733689.1 FAS1 domain-containing protein [Lasiosphaeria miniovina]
MYLPHLLPLALAAYVSAEALSTVLAASSASLSTLSSLLTGVPDLVQALSTAQNITILAPSNNAFTKLLSRNPKAAELMQNTRALTGVLQYHVLLGKIPASQFSTTPSFAATMLGTPFANVTGGQRVELAKVNNTAMIFSGFKQPAMDVEFDGGIIHIIDTVLTVPASPSLTAINTGLTSLAGALASVQLDTGVNQLTDATIFAPSNEAFKAIGSAAGSLQSQDVVNILAYHVLAQQVRFSPDLLTGSPRSFMTIQGTNLTVRSENGQLFVNSARVLVADILTTNGVVHVIDNVLNPGNTTATPDASATSQAPAFSGVTPVLDAPFTSGVVPTATFVPASVPLTAGSAAPATAPGMAGLVVCAVGAAAVLMASL